MKIPFTRQEISDSRRSRLQPEGPGGAEPRRFRFASVVTLFCIVVISTLTVAWWLFFGESFLSLTRRLPAEVLIVEGWIGRDGIRAAALEFQQHGYQYVVATGGRLTEGNPGPGATFAEIAEQELIRAGVPADRIIVAAASDPEGQHTFESAMATWRALRAKHIYPQAINVFTRGTHARRSQLVFAKVNQPESQVGVVSWIPSDYLAAPWWQSPERFRCMLKEPVGYLFETWFNSGRRSNAPDPGLLAS